MNNEKTYNGHVLYTNRDADAPDVIKDRHGCVVLSLCKICGRGEIELDGPCRPKKKYNKKQNSNQ